METIVEYWRDMNEAYFKINKITGLRCDKELAVGEFWEEGFSKCQILQNCFFATQKQVQYIVFSIFRKDCFDSYERNIVSCDHIFRGHLTTSVCIGMDHQVIKVHGHVKFTKLFFRNSKTGTGTLCLVFFARTVLTHTNSILGVGSPYFAGI